MRTEYKRNIKTVIPVSISTLEDPDPDSDPAHTGGDDLHISSLGSG